MSELSGVLKNFAFACVLVLLMQIKVGGRSIESRAEAWLQTSSTALVLQDVAAGAAKALWNFSKSLRDGAEKAAEGFSEGNQDSPPPPKRKHTAFD